MDNEFEIDSQEEQIECEFCDEYYKAIKLFEKKKKSTIKPVAASQEFDAGFRHIIYDENGGKCYMTNYGRFPLIYCPVCGDRLRTDSE